MNKSKYDVLIFIPLIEEYNTFSEVFEFNTDLTEDGSFIAEFLIAEGVRALVTVADGMGNSSAARAVREAFERFDFNMVICIGIAGGISNDLKYGDVCFTGNVYNILDNAKTTDKGKVGISISPSPAPYTTPRIISNSLEHLFLNPDKTALYNSWREESETWSRQFLNEKAGKDYADRHDVKPNAKKSNIVCAAVSASKNYNSMVKGIDRKISAVDTESGAVFEFSQDKLVPALSVRGISDLADGDKNQLELDTDGAFRKIAARNAATFLKLIFEKNERFKKHVQFAEIGMSTRGAQESTRTGFTNLSELYDYIEEKINVQLEELLPEYKVVDKGYLLPTPRIRRSEQNLNRSKNSDGKRFEIIDCLRFNKNLFISLDRNYPDKALAWIVANEMLRSKIDDRYIVPIVIDGGSVTPPRGKLKGLASEEFNAILDFSNIVVVIILDGVPLTSKSKMNFLIKEIEENEDAKFIFIDRTYSNLFIEGKFESTLSAAHYNVCEVSFQQISHFLQKSHSVNNTEADVMALRLRETFKKYDLEAHPSYFAGISRTTLNSLIRANRRSELIELAVTGFLSFAVAGDDSDILLSRSARFRFLQSFAIEYLVEKTQFTPEDLIQYTTRFAEEFDFDIDIIKFIQNFVDHGILHYEDGYAKISLAFIEHYVLAVALGGKPDIAKRYFRLDDLEFDLATFDLYAEIGASDEMIRSIVEKMTELFGNCARKKGDFPTICDGGISIAKAMTTKRIQSIKNKLDEAVQSVVNDKNDTHNKQQMLDIFDHVQRATKERAQESVEDFDNGSAESPSVEVEVSDEEEISEQIAVWTVGLYLLGSGAEHLNAHDKRNLTELIVYGMDFLSDAWVIEARRIDFESMKKTITTDEAIEKLMAQSPGERTKEEVTNMCSQVVDTIEYLSLTMPFHKFVGVLSDFARNPVLYKSLSNAKIGNEFQNIIRLIWMNDINTTRGKTSLKGALKSLPPAPLFRLCLTNHFLVRVYWHIAGKKDRLAMIDLAEEVLKPTSLQLGKGELIRMVESDADQLSTPPSLRFLDKCPDLRCSWRSVAGPKHEKRPIPPSQRGGGALVERAVARPLTAGNRERATQVRVRRRSGP